MIYQNLNISVTYQLIVVNDTYKIKTCFLFIFWHILTMNIIYVHIFGYTKISFLNFCFLSTDILLMNTHDPNFMYLQGTVSKIQLSP